MKYIRLFNFVDVCSRSFLNILNYVYDNNPGKRKDGKIFIDISSKNIKNILSESIEEELEKYSGVFLNGHKNIIINTCSPENNWKNKSKEIFYKYQINDKSVILSKYNLQFILDDYWDLLKSNKNYILIENWELDCLDLAFLIEEFVGNSHINLIKSNFNFIQDGNKKFKSRGEIPLYLKDDIEFQLRKNNLIL